MYPWFCAFSMVSAASVSVPIWFTLIMMAFAAPFWMPWLKRSLFVVNRSSPQMRQFLAFRVSSAVLSKSSS